MSSPLHITATKRLVLAAGLWITAMSASAGVQLDASVAAFQIQLVDLDPADGIAPALTFEDGSSYGRTSANSGSASMDSRSVSLPTPFQAGSDSLSLGPFTGTFSLQGSGVLQGAGLSSHLANTLDTAAGYSSGDSYAGFVARFSLTPHTRLVVSALVTTDVQSFMTGRIDNQLTIYGQLVMREPNVDGSYQSASSSMLPPRIAGTFVRHKEEVVSLDFVNTTSGVLAGEFWANAYVHQMLLPVPEPDSSAMFALGLGLIGGLLCKRRHG